MPTGYVVSGRGDLDVLFLARSSAAGANTGYKSNGGVDLAQRFEPRGATTAIAATGFRVAGTDLAQIFKSIGAVVGDRVMLADQKGASLFGYDDGTMDAGSVYGSLSNKVVGGYNVVWFYRDTGLNAVRLGFARNGVFPPNDNTVWTSVQVNGVFNDSGGAPVTRTLVRSAAVSSATQGPTGANQYLRYWTFTTAAASFIAGNTYGLAFTVG